MGRIYTFVTATEEADRETAESDKIQAKSVHTPYYY